MQDSKKFSPSLAWSIFIILGAGVLIFLLYKGASFKPGSQFLPASVGKILNASPDRILVKFKSNASDLRRSEINSKYALKENSEIKNIGVKIVSIPSGIKPEAMVEALNNNEKDAIEFAEPDFVVEPSLVPNDPWFANWQKDKTQINLPGAWDITTGTSNTVIAVVDTGVNCSHEDLAGQCLAGWNFYDNNSTTTDVNGHGTRVAGVAAAVGNNALGVAGTSWQSKILPLRVAAPDGSATYSSIASAISYAADHGAKVVNASYQVGGSSAVERAASYLASKGGLLVVSEGNYSSDTGYSNSLNIISVSAVDANQALYSWSSFGSDVDVAAPGCTGATTYENGGYGSFCGTSNAAPEVAGLLALMWGANPGLTPDQVSDILFKSTIDLGASGVDKYYGWGTIDAATAVNLAKEYIATPTSTPISTPTKGKCRSGKKC